MPHTPIRVHLADGDFLLRLGLEALLSACDDVQLEAVCSTGTEAIEAAVLQQPDIVLMESNIKDVESVEATTRIIADAPGTQIVMLSAIHDLDTINRAHAAGASSYLAKNTISNDLGSALRLIKAGNAIYSQPADAQRFPQKMSLANPTEMRLLRQVNTRDRSILEGVAHGKTNKQIADRLHVSEGTVKAQLAKIMEPLHVDNRVQLAVLVIKAGLLDAAPHARSPRSIRQDSMYSTPRP